MTRAEAIRIAAELVLKKELDDARQWVRDAKALAEHYARWRGAREYVETWQRDDKAAQRDLKKARAHLARIRAAIKALRTKGGA